MSSSMLRWSRNCAGVGALALAMAGCDALPTEIDDFVAALGDESGNSGFLGVVAGVNLETSLFELTGGTRVRVDAETQFTTDLASLEAVVHWLEEEGVVVASGSGSREADGANPAIVADDLALRVTPAAEFEGVVTAIDLTAPSLTLENGTVVVLSADTRRGDTGFETLVAAAEAFAAGKSLVSWGHGALLGEEPRTVYAVQIVIKEPGPPQAEFEGHVVSTNLEAGTFTLSNGTVVHVSGETDYNDDSDITTLAAARAALDAGHDLVAWGHGALVSEEPRTIEATKVTFRVPPPPVEDFEGHVATVQLDAGSFTLANGWVIRIGEDTDFNTEFGIGSLEAAADALAGLTEGQALIAWGEGPVEGEEPVKLLAAHVTLRVIEVQ